VTPAPPCAPARWRTAPASRALALLLLLGAAPAWATPDRATPGPMLVASTEAEALLEQGRAHMIAFRLAEADQTFERLARLDPTGPAGPAHLAKTAWWRALTMEQPPLYDAFFERSDAALAALRDVPDGPWRHHFRGEIELQRATVFAKQAEYLKAALALRQAYNNFERNARQHPDFHESRWGMGLCYVTVASVPRPFRWVLRTLGFRGTVTAGMREIAASADRSQYYRDEASVFLAFLDEALQEGRGNGLRRLRQVHARHPDSPATAYLLGVGLLTTRDAAGAERALRAADAALARPGVYPIPYVDYYLGEALFRQDRFGEAAGRFERFLGAFPGKAHRAQGHLKAGLAREMAGDRPAALRHYRAVEVRRDYDSDASALRAAQARVAAPLSAHERALLRAQNAFDAGRYAEAVRLAQPVMTDTAAPPLARAEAAYRAGRGYHLQGQWAQALQHYEYAVHNPGDPVAKWGPWSQLYLGEVHAARGDRAAARAAFDRVLALEQPVEFHKSLEQRARAARERL
jgi:tetratricopeptide (TPR) repeat protein